MFPGPAPNRRRLEVESASSEKFSLPEKITKKKNAAPGLREAAFWLFSWEVKRGKFAVSGKNRRWPTQSAIRRPVLTPPVETAGAAVSAGSSVWAVAGVEKVAEAPGADCVCGWAVAGAV